MHLSEHVELRGNQSPIWPVDDTPVMPGLQRGYSDSVQFSSGNSVSYSPTAVVAAATGSPQQLGNARRTTTGSRSLSRAIRNNAQDALVNAANADRRFESPHRSPLAVSPKASPSPSPSPNPTKYQHLGARQSFSPHAARNSLSPNVVHDKSMPGPLSVSAPRLSSSPGRGTVTGPSPMRAASPSPVRSPYSRTYCAPLSPLMFMSPVSTNLHAVNPTQTTTVQPQPGSELISSPDNQSVTSRSVVEGLDDTWRDAIGSPTVSSKAESAISGDRSSAAADLSDALEQQRPVVVEDEDTENLPPEANRQSTAETLASKPLDPVKKLSPPRVPRSPTSPAQRNGIFTQNKVVGFQGGRGSDSADATMRSPAPPAGVSPLLTRTPPRTTLDVSKTVKSAAEITAGAADVVSKSAVKKAVKCPASAKKRMSVLDSHSVDVSIGTTSKPKNKDGRPSLGTMLNQWRFMRSNFLQGDEDELEWLMAAKQPGAYAVAHRRFCDFEDMYFKCLCDIDRAERFEAVYKEHSGAILACLKSLESIHSENKVDGDAVDSTVTSADAISQVRESQTQLTGILQKIDDAKQLFSELFWQLTSEFLLVETEHSEASSLAVKLQQQLLSDRDACRALLLESRRASESHLAEMEKWRKRERETADYDEVMSSIDAQWRTTEEEANRDALRTMRTYLPTGIAEMTNEVYQAHVDSQGGVYSIELLSELKKNKFLHWLVMHPEDIAASNFLVGDGKQYFESLETYDLVELRALSLCVPESFAVDGDGKKAEWRGRFMARVKLLVSQHRGESVKGGWDPVTNQRAMVTIQLIFTYILNIR